jgi:hypothetical protein
MQRELQQANSSSTTTWRTTPTSQSPQNPKGSYGKKYKSEGKIQKFARTINFLRLQENYNY